MENGSMKDKFGAYQEYVEGMELPAGIYPPMPGYTHDDLVLAAAERVAGYLTQENIDETLARETLIALGVHLREKFEEEITEYQIATWYQKPYSDPTAQARAVNTMAEDFGAAAIEAMGYSLDGSPLLAKGKVFFRELCMRAGDGVSDLILTLKR